jgi:hypothetical protein
METAGLVCSPVKQKTSFADAAANPVADGFGAALAESMSIAETAMQSSRAKPDKAVGKHDLRVQAETLPTRDEDGKAPTVAMNPNLLLPVVLAANVIPLIAPSLAPQAISQPAGVVDDAGSSQSGMSPADITAATVALFAHTQTSIPFLLHSLPVAPSRVGPTLAPAGGGGTLIIPAQRAPSANSPSEVVSSHVAFANLKSGAAPDVEVSANFQGSGDVRAGTILTAQVKAAVSHPPPPAPSRPVVSISADTPQLPDAAPDSPPSNSPQSFSNTPSNVSPDGMTAIVAKAVTSSVSDVEQTTSSQDAARQVAEVTREAQPPLSNQPLLSTIPPVADPAPLSPSDGPKATSSQTKSGDQPPDPVGTRATPTTQLIDVPPPNVAVISDVLTPLAGNAVVAEPFNVVAGRKASDTEPGKATPDAALTLTDEIRSAKAAGDPTPPQVTDTPVGSNQSHTTMVDTGQSAGQSKDDAAKKSSASTLPTATFANDVQPFSAPAAATTVAVPREGTAPLPLSNPSDACDPSPAAPLQQPLQPAASSPDNARITTDAAGEMQMRVGIRTTAFGAVEIYTSVHQNQVGLSVHGERGMEHWLSTEVQSIESGLKDHHLHLTTVELDRSGTGLQTSTGSQQQHSQRGFAAARNWRAQPAEQPAVEALPIEPAKVWTDWPGGNRVSIHV